MWISRYIIFYIIYFSSNIMCFHPLLCIIAQRMYCVPIQQASTCTFCRTRGQRSQETALSICWPPRIATLSKHTLFPGGVAFGFFFGKIGTRLEEYPKSATGASPAMARKGKQKFWNFLVFVNMKAQTSWRRHSCWFADNCPRTEPQLVERRESRGSALWGSS